MANETVGVGHVQYAMPHGNDYLVSSPFPLSRFEIYDDKIKVYDAVWGNEKIGDWEGDQVLLDIIGSPLSERLMGIEQLTLSPAHATMPNTTDWSRYESQWGSVVLTRKLLEKAEQAGHVYSPREKTILQLRTLLSDFGHTAMSHLGDWVTQGVGGPEDAHEKELGLMLEVGGINEILTRHNIDPAEVNSPNVEDWVECKSPDLCIDRVDYGAREIRRWADFSMAVHFATNLDAFSVDEQGRMVMVDYTKAKTFATAFAMLPTEHWGHPTHRLQEHLLVECVKRMFVNDEALFVSTWERQADTYHPRDFLYSIDRDFMGSLGVIDKLTWIIDPMMRHIAHDQRRIFATVRYQELENYFSELEFGKNNIAFPNPMTGTNWRSEFHPLIPSNLSFEAVSEPPSQRFWPSTEGVNLYLPHFKRRYVDPLFEDSDGNIHRLSEYDPKFKEMLGEQREVHEEDYIATVHVSSDYKQKIVDGLKENEELWPNALERPRMDKDKLAHLLGDAAMYAVPTRLVAVDWYR